VYRSDDAGENWTRITTDSRPAGRIGGGDLPVPAVNPKNPDVVFMASTVTWKSIDGGKTWTHITNGIPDGAPVNVVREDPKRKGLLFAGTEREVFVSFDDGEHWQSLRLNMPASSMRDLIVKDDDLVLATHGRGFWILDNPPLRQIDQTVVEAAAFLFRPQTAFRVRWNMNTDTPWPPDEPRGPNPPDGAIIDYTLKTAVSGPVTIEILDTAGTLVRRYASSDPVETVDPATAAVPLYWYRPAQRLATSPGMHRFTWDLHYQPLPGGGGRGGLPIAAVPFNTAAPPNAPWVAPGQNTVRLTVDGLLLQILKRSSNALRDVACRAEPVSRSTVARALKSGQAVKASFGVTRAVIGCMHS